MAVSVVLAVLVTVMSFRDLVAARQKGHVPSVAEYFPELKGDLTKVMWAHAVNNKASLESALEDIDIMMIEADVVLGTANGGSDLIPIMAHPPAQTSDLSLRMFLETFVKAATRKIRKGIKLDFKSDECFELSWPLINSFISQVDFPFFLNADILPGPVNSTTKPVDANLFLTLSKSNFPESTISIGWTTNFGLDIEGEYSADQLDSMKNTLVNNGISQPVTLCLRAGLAAESRGIMDLVNEIDRCQHGNTTSVTIWMSNNADPVDVPNLKKLILELGQNRVLLDVPKFIRDELNLPNIST